MDELLLLLRVMVAGGLSALIGIEREFHGRPAGLRTHLLVGTGAALVMAAFEAASHAIGGDGGLIRLDPGRLAAGVITGIGFLGAGTIIKVGDWVRGLTTAASLWLVAAVGIVAGQGLYVIAGGGCLLGLAILSIVDPLSAWIPTRVYHTFEVTVEAGKRQDVAVAFRSVCMELRIRATQVGWVWNGERAEVRISYRLRHSSSTDVEALADRMIMLDAVRDAALRL